jgi:hypothetical protein
LFFSPFRTVASVAHFGRDTADILAGFGLTRGNPLASGYSRTCGCRDQHKTLVRPGHRFLQLKGSVVDLFQRTAYFLPAPTAMSTKRHTVFYQRASIMTDTKDKSSLERLLRPLRRELNPELAAALLRMQADDELQTRYEYLAERNTEGLLDPEEQIELVSLVRANTLLSVLKAEARAFLQHPSAA